MSNSTVAPSIRDAKWEGQKEKLLSKFPGLKEEDLEYEEGKRDEMFSLVQIKLGRTSEEMEAVISAL